MAGRERGTRLRDSNHRTSDASLPSILLMPPTREEVSICDAVSRLSPRVDPLLVLESLRKDAHSRRERVQHLRRRILAGNYHVSDGAVAAAVLLEGDLLLQ